MEIEAPTGERWELALDLVRSGEAEVVYRGVSLWRSTTGPRADGRISVAILTNAFADVPEDRRTSEIERGRQAVADLLAADPRLGDLFDTFGACWSYVYADGHTRVTLEDLGDQ